MLKSVRSQLLGSQSTYSGLIHVHVFFFETGYKIPLHQHEITLSIKFSLVYKDAHRLHENDNHGETQGSNNYILNKSTALGSITNPSEQIVSTNISRGKCSLSFCIKIISNPSDFI